MTAAEKEATPQAEKTAAEAAAEGQEETEQGVTGSITNIDLKRGLCPLLRA